MDNKLYFKNKFRIPSARWDGWDYSNTGFYFITICTFNKKILFGEIKNENIFLSNIGEMVKKFWLEIPAHFKNVILDEFIIMPNHLHGIIVIKNCDAQKIDAPNQPIRRDVAMQRLYNGDSPQMSEISPKKNTISSIIRSYKSVVSKTINLERNKKINLWQPRFYDRIIRNDEELNKIRKYISDNILRWDIDRNNPKNIKNIVFAF